MKLKALVIESTGYYRGVLDKILSDIGVECDVYGSAKEALESDISVEYAFILVSRYLEDTSAELFLHHYREKWPLSDALTIMLTADDVTEIMLDANKAGFKLIFNKQDIDSLQTSLISALNNRSITLKGRILFIEDQKSIAVWTVALFEKHHAEIDLVTNIADAKVKFSNINYDLVITDYYLENNESGDDIIQLVRTFNDVDKARIPILVLSGESDPKKRTLFLRNGANDFIIKPYDEEELIVRSANLIENKRLFEQARNQQRELTKLAMTDQLTGLYNRHSLFDIGPKYLRDAKRHKFPVSLLVIDIDHFKKVNDTHGHGVGDSILKSVGQLLNDHCRKEDLVARFGGEEFVMLLSHCGLDYAVTKAEEIRQAVEKAKPNDLLITTSIGAAEFSENDDVESLFDKADKALYEAKESGRNKVIFCTEN